MIKSQAFSKQRIQWVDCAKGITILLVIVGHSIDTFWGGTLRGLIFSFHMPLFFILSAMTYTYSKNEGDFLSKTKHACKHLLIPAFITFAILTLYEVCKDFNLIMDTGYLQDKIYTLIYACGVDAKINNINVIHIGLAWFFFALFIGRSMFDYVHLKFSQGQVIVICCILCIGGLYFGSTQWLPFSIDVALAVIPFFYAGYLIKNYDLNKHPYRKLIIWGLIWLMTFFLGYTDPEERTYLELAWRRYNFFPICYLTAIAGTLCLCELCNIMLKVKYIMEPFVYLGKNSLYLLCIHALDSIWLDYWYVEGNQFVAAVRRFVMDILIFVIFMLIRHVIKSVMEKKIAAT